MQYPKGLATPPIAPLYKATLQAPSWYHGGMQLLHPDFWWQQTLEYSHHTTIGPDCLSIQVRDEASTINLSRCTMTPLVVKSRSDLQRSSMRYAAILVLISTGRWSIAIAILYKPAPTNIQHIACHDMLVLVACIWCLCTINSVVQKGAQPVGQRWNPQNFQNAASANHKLSLSLRRRLKRLWLGVIMGIGLRV